MRFVKLKPLFFSYFFTVFELFPEKTNIPDRISCKNYSEKTELFRQNFLSIIYHILGKCQNKNRNIMKIVRDIFSFKSRTALKSVPKNRKRTVTPKGNRCAVQ